MAVDTPAKVAVIGAGPTGLEAALYARYLGYEVEIYEKADCVAPVVETFGDSHMLTPLASNATSLGMAALKSHDETFQLADNAGANYCTWRDRYLLPLAQTDLIADSLKLTSEVISIGKVEIKKTDCPEGEYDRGAWDFRLLIRDANKSERIVAADVVLDCSGRSLHAPMGHGGIPAANEFSRDWQGRVLYGMDAIKWAQAKQKVAFGPRILLVGDYPSVAWIACIMAALPNRFSLPPGQITWATDSETGPFNLGRDQLTLRTSMFLQVNEAVSSGSIRWLPASWIESLEQAEDNTIQVTFAGTQDFVEAFDQILVNSGERPDFTLASELQFNLCRANEIVRPLVPSLTNFQSALSDQYPIDSPEALLSGEPNYYILGSKSFGRLPGYLPHFGHQQIRDVFTIIGDRPDLDLYKRYAEQE